MVPWVKSPLGISASVEPRLYLHFSFLQMCLEASSDAFCDIREMLAPCFNLTLIGCHKNLESEPEGG